MKAFSIILLGFLYLHMETRFFGSNWAPTSAEEVLADGIGAIIVAIGIANLGDKNKKS